MLIAQSNQKMDGEGEREHQQLTTTHFVAVTTTMYQQQHNQWLKCPTTINNSSKAQQQ